jgi:hypothetical protein
MATQASLILSVRRRVADAVTPYTYVDPYYEQSLDFALGKLNFDWGTTFTDVTLVTTQYEFLLLKLATIEMCQIRSTEVTSGDAQSYQMITVPDLMVQKVSRSANDAWLALAKALQEEYDGELESGGGEGAIGGTVSEAKMYRQSLRTYGLRPYELAEALTPPTLSASVSGTTVTLSWTPIITSTYFWTYDVYRSTNADMSSGEKIAGLTDNHDDEYIDENLTAGTYYYRLTVVESSSLESYTNIVTAVVS